MFGMAETKPQIPRTKGGNNHEGFRNMNAKFTQHSTASMRNGNLRLLPTIRRPVTPTAI